jgi:hypothetical protein
MLDGQEVSSYAIIPSPVKLVQDRVLWNCLPSRSLRFKCPNWSIPEFVPPEPVETAQVSAKSQRFLCTMQAQTCADAQETFDKVAF